MIRYVNCTAHLVRVRMPSGRTITMPPAVKAARVTQRWGPITEDGLCEMRWGPVEGLPKPKPDTLYVVSALVLELCPERQDLVAPAGGHPATVRHVGRPSMVPGFYKRRPR